MNDLITGWKMQLALELEIEQLEAIQDQNGIAIELINTSTGLGGRCIAKIKSVNPLNEWTIRNGDIIRLLKMDKSAVVYKVSSSFVYLAFEDEIDFNHDKLIKLPNTVMYTRIDKVLDGLPLINNSLIDICFNNKKPQFISSDFEFIDLQLNEQQRIAVDKSIQSIDIHAIHGPPGTGKTQTLIEIIRQLFIKTKTILICGPSNLSVDNIVERLSNINIPCLRIGHPARLLPSVQDKALEYIVDNCTFGGEVLHDIKQEIDSLNRKVHSCKSKRDKYLLYKDIRELKKEFKKREKKVIFEQTHKFLIHCCTLSNAMNKHTRDYYDVVIIDEVCQAIEPECWIALQKSSKAIIAGDPLQLPPVVKSKPNKLANLEISLMERVLKSTAVCTLLQVQYRMNKEINAFPSKHIYNDKLVCHNSNENIRITDHFKVEEEFTFPVVFYDNLHQSIELQDDSKSIYNEGELQNIKEVVDSLIKNNIPESFIGVIAAYNAQVSRLKVLLPYKDIEIGTVDGFQGREKEIILISTVRCNDDHSIGFLSEKRRMNVAITRAKMLLILFGDSETMERNEFLTSLLDWASMESLYYYHD